MFQSVQLFLAEFLAGNRVEIVEVATDWVIAEAVDLKGARPREETRRLVERVFSWNAALLLRSDEAPLIEFIGFVTTFRASSEFHISTLLRGFGSFRAALAQVLAPPRVEPALAFASLVKADEAYGRAIFLMADEYVAKLNHTIIQRRQELELLALQRQREFDEALGIIHAQEELLRTVSLPIIRIWDGVLVVPLIGELTPERSSDLLLKLLEMVVAERARVVILDITGLQSMDAAAARGLGKVAQAARLLGARAQLVGVSAAAAATLARLAASMTELPAFATLADGLRLALGTQGYQIIKTLPRGPARPAGHLRAAEKPGSK